VTIGQNVVEENLRPLLGQRINAIARYGNELLLRFGPKINNTLDSGKTWEVSSYCLDAQCAWRKIHPNFDFVSAALMKKLEDEPARVTNVCADKYGGFSLAFDNGWRLDAFPDGLGNQEHWHFFERENNSEHFVVFDT
jgi:hypothetical protein